MDNFYREIILDHYKNPKNFGKLVNPSVSFSKNNPFCGDEIRIDLKINSKKQVEAVKFSGVGCAISIAAASLLTEYVKKRTIGEVNKLKKGDMLRLLDNIELSPVRLKCALLPLEVLQKAISFYKISL